MSEDDSDRIDAEKFALAEYSALRDEIQKRSDFQHQLVYLALVALGVFLSFSASSGANTNTTSDSSSIVLLIYPLLAMFLAFDWGHHHRHIHRLGEYIRNNIEGRVKGVTWERYSFENLNSFKPGIFLVITSTRGVFVGTQIVAIMIVVLSKTSLSPLKVTLSPMEIGFLIADLTALVLTLIAVRRVLKRN